MEENDKEEREPFNIKFTKQKAYSEMMKVLLTLNDRMYNKKTRKILLWLTSLRAYKILMIIKFSKKVILMIEISYLMKRKFKKIFLEVISNTKIFNIKFCSMKLPITKILPNLHRLDKGGLDNVEYGNLRSIIILFHRYKSYILQTILSNLTLTTKFCKNWEWNKQKNWPFSNFLN